MGALTVVSAGSTIRWDGGFGDRNVRPTSAAALADEYSYAFGSMTLDLRGVELPAGETTLRVSIAFGDLVVQLPPGVPARITGRTVFGSSALLGRQFDGITVDHATQSADYGPSASRRLTIDLSTVFGSATVR